MKRGTAGQMRLNREAKMCKKDMDAQIKKQGKITDNFICLPDPEDSYLWHYVVFGLDDAPYKGGYYMGNIVCPPEYPAKAPTINLITENGRFKLQKEQPDGICLSISSLHPESWNPAWKVNQIVIGLISFWLTNESTYGSVESYDYPRDMPIKERSLGFAMKSRHEVLKNEKFQAIFGAYADAIGINQEQVVEGWAEHKIKVEKIQAEKEAAEAKRVEEARIAEEARLAKIEEEKRIAKELAEKSAIKDYFKILKRKNLTQYVGQPNHVKNALRRMQA